MSTNPNQIIREICKLITAGDISSAATKINNEYPFVLYEKGSRKYTPREMTRIFVRDGFIDRYKGVELVYPPALQVISNYFPTEFPYHKHAKMDACHNAYWELMPTIDHVVPVARGGKNIEENLVCCSMLTNSIKANWTLEELEWKLLPSGDVSNWDGMIHWFIEQVERDKNLLTTPYIKRWYYTAKEVTAPHKPGNHLQAP